MVTSTGDDAECKKIPFYYFSSTCHHLWISTQLNGPNLVLTIAKAMTMFAIGIETIGIELPLPDINKVK